jgi:uncharacterized protein (TIGR02145 family)
MYNDGTEIPNVTDNADWLTLATPVYCFFQNTADADTIVKYGALYNWYAVESDRLPPDNWHVPTDVEWDTLQFFLIANAYNWDGTTEGNKISKSLAAMTDWRLHDTQGRIGNDLPSNNRSGFSGLPGGVRHGNIEGDFCCRYEYGHWWTATDTVTTHAFIRRLFWGHDGIGRAMNLKECGNSVRLVRNY